MQSRAARAAIAVGAIAVIVVLFVVLNGGGDDNGGTTTSTQEAQSTNPDDTGTIGATNGATGRDGSGAAAGATDAGGAPVAPKAYTVIVRNGKPAGGVRRLKYKKDERVRLVVDSDVADEIHVHGYDLKKDVPAGGKVRFSFPASIEGVFEIELEGRKQQIAELRVEPS